MPTIAIIGAGPGLGLAIARRFGAEGFAVALLARNQDKLRSLVATLTKEGITAAAFPADVLDPESLISALGTVAQALGSIDVLEYSPADASAGPLAPVDVRDTTPQQIQPQVAYYLYGAMTAVQAVLPSMRAAGSGTLLFTTGAGSTTPVPMFGNITPAAAALRNWALNLGAALEADGTGIHAAHVAIGVWITEQAPAGVPSLTADQIAPAYWDLHVRRGDHERIITE